MGDVADSMRDGTCCADCGVFLDFSKKSGEKAYALYDLQYFNQVSEITREDHTLWTPEELGVTSDEMVKKNICDWKSIGIPLLCFDCYKEYLDCTTVYDVKLEVTQRVKLTVRVPSGNNPQEAGRFAAMFYEMEENVVKADIKLSEKAKNQSVIPPDDTGINKTS